ncbi:MAG: hypothetical protein KDC33_03455 [Thermoleophilia bacterium]|nr:hypothetical protein [Thermoleophilia bacterium]
MGSVFVALYALFALAAGARSAFQLATKFGDAPLAYLLSAAAAVIYAVAAYCFARPSATSYRTGRAALLVELAGVVGVGALSVAQPDDFPDQTVWSNFGEGYGFIPLILPVVGLWWLSRSRTREGFAEGRLT